MQTPSAASELAAAYTVGAVLPRDPKRAWQLNCIATLRGDTYGMCQLGDAFEHGRGVDENVIAARNIYLAVLATPGSDYANATANLARMHLVGKGAEVDVMRAHWLYELAAGALVGAHSANASLTDGAASVHEHHVPRRSALAIVASALVAGRGCIPDPVHATLLRQLDDNDTVVATPRPPPSRSLAALPAEVFWRVLAHLSPIDLVSARKVCRAWRALVHAYEVVDARHAFRCELVMPSTPARDGSAPTAATCTCGALVDPVTALLRAGRPSHHSGAVEQPYARAHGGRLPPALWRDIASARAVASALQRAAAPISGRYLVNIGLPVVGRAGPDADDFSDSETYPFGDTSWKGGHVSLPPTLSLPQSSLQMPSFMFAVLFGEGGGEQGVHAGRRVPW